jgi:hypothetical protein
MSYRSWQIHKGGKTNPLREPMVLFYFTVVVTLFLAITIRMSM